VRQEDLPALWQGLVAAGLATPDVKLITDIIACPGMDSCSLALARHSVARRISGRCDDPGRQPAIGPLHIDISGCINACGHHHLSHIGLLDVDQRGEDVYQVMLGSASRPRPARPPWPPRCAAGGDARWLAISTDESGGRRRVASVARQWFH